MQNWTAEGIADCVAVQSGESLVLEFKSQLPDFSDRGKAELLKDIAAMANASGGTILYGVSEHDGRAAALSGTVIQNSDELLRRIMQIIQEGIEPRLPKIYPYIVNLPDCDVFVIEVPQSFDGPHRFKFNGNYRFVRRYDRHIADLTYQQLRAAFDRGADRRKAIQDAWADEFRPQSFWRPAQPGPAVMVRLSPLVSADGEQILDPKRVYERWPELIMSGWSGGSHAFNYDGFAVYPGGVSGFLSAFVQVHRSGAITTWRTLVSPYEDEKSFYGGFVVAFVKDSLRVQKVILNNNGIAGPCVLNIGLRKIEGHSLVVDDGFRSRGRYFSPVSDLNMPSVWIEDIENLDEVRGEVFSQAADILWQAYGLPGCPADVLQGSY